MIEIRQVRGPLDDEQLRWIAALYGPVDGKYRSREYVRHQFVGNPFGWSVHVFAVADGKGVGHCGVVPFQARNEDGPFVAGKLEALAVEEAYRGPRPELGRSVATAVLETLYAFALDSGIEVLFGLAPAPVAAIHVRAGCRQAPLDAVAYVHIASPRAFAAGQATARRKALVLALAVAQKTALAAAFLAARLVGGAWAAPAVGPPAPGDAALARAGPAPGSWTVSGADAWEWYAGSGVLKAVDLSGRFGSRAIVRMDDLPGTAIQIVAWRPRRGGLLPALILLGAVAALARRASAPTVRFQAWSGDGGNGALSRACQLLGFARRPESDLLVNTRDPHLAQQEVSLTPFFYVTF